MAFTLIVDVAAAAVVVIVAFTADDIAIAEHIDLIVEVCFLDFVNSTRTLSNNNTWNDDDEVSRMRISRATFFRMLCPKCIFTHSLYIVYGNINAYRYQCPLQCVFSCLRNFTPAIYPSFIDNVVPCIGAEMKSENETPLYPLTMIFLINTVYTRI